MLSIENTISYTSKKIENTAHFELEFPTTKDPSELKPLNSRNNGSLNKTGHQLWGPKLPRVEDYNTKIRGQ